MKLQQRKPIFSSIYDIFKSDVASTKTASEMRPLSDEEVRAVAGGPECEVGTGG